jgi:uncharacterized protein involved in exopolysaccharide biosynthesis
MATLALGIATAIYWPRTYEVSVRILAQRNLVLPALDNPQNAENRDADNLTKNAADAILKRDNLLALIKQLDLLDRWQATRQPLLRVKDKIMATFGKTTDEERLRNMVGVLGKRLTVAADDATITITVVWSDKQTAFDIASALQKNFLDARYDSSLDVVKDAIHILEERAKPEAVDVDAALAELMKLDAQHREGLAGAASAQPSARAWARPTVATAAGSRVVSTPPDDAVAQDLEDVRRRLRLLKESRDQELLQAQAQLSEARTTLGPLHPTIRALNEKIAQLSEPSPELNALRARERSLVAQLAGPAMRPAAASLNGSARPQAEVPLVIEARPLARPAQTVRDLLDVHEDPQVTQARANLQAVTAKYNDLLARIDAANIELEVTRAAFKYQYSVVQPPELPREPIKPKIALLLAAAALLAALLTFAVPGGLDLFAGRFVESWQIESRLKLPVVGEIAALMMGRGP